MWRILLCAGALLSTVAVYGINGLSEEGDSYSASVYVKDPLNFREVRLISNEDFKNTFSVPSDVRSNLVEYPEVSPSSEFTYPPPALSVTGKPLKMGYPKVTPSNQFTYTSKSSTTSKPIPTGYPKVTPSKEFTYPSTKPITTTKPSITGYPKVTPTRDFRYPTTSVTSAKSIVTGYTKVTPGKHFTYPSSTQSTKPPITGYQKITPNRDFTYPTTSTTTTKLIVTGYPKVSPSKEFSYPSTTPSTSRKPPIRGYPKVTPSREFTYPTTSMTTTKPIVKGYPKVSPSKAFTYPSTPLSITTKSPIIGYGEATPSREYPYRTSTTTLQPIISGYPRVTPGIESTYPSPTPTISVSSIARYPEALSNNNLPYPSSLHSTGSNVTDPRVTFVNFPVAPGRELSTIQRFPVLDHADLSPYENYDLTDNASVPSSNARSRVYRSLPPIRDKIGSRSVDDDEQDDDEEEEDDEEKHRKWNIRASVPGEPGRDYPILSSIPVTNFSCTGKIEGYFADHQTGCQVFHLCSEGAGNVKSSFLCPNGSIFNERILTCDWWRNVECKPRERQNHATIPRNPSSLPALINAQNSRRSYGALQRQSSSSKLGARFQPILKSNGAAPIHSGVRLSSNLKQYLSGNLGGRVQNNNTPSTIHLRPGEFSNNGNVFALNPDDVVLDTLNNSAPGRTEIEIIKSVQINNTNMELLNVEAESNETDLNLSISQSELGKPSDLVTHMVISKSAFPDELERRIPEMSHSASIFAASLNENFGFKLESPQLFSEKVSTTKNQAFNLDSSRYSSEESSAPLLIPSLSFDFKTLEDKQDFVKAVAAGVLSHKPSQSDPK